MQSIIVILALILFFIFIYGYALSFYDKHRSENKKSYIPIYENKNNDIIEPFTVGGEDNADTCSPDANAGDNDYCYNGGTCISVSGTDGGTYNKCKCVEPFSGTHCGLGEQKIGVQVLIRDNFTSPTVIERIPMFKYEGHDYFIQDNDYL